MGGGSVNVERAAVTGFRKPEGIQLPSHNPLKARELGYTPQAIRTGR